MGIRPGFRVLAYGDLAVRPPPAVKLAVNRRPIAPRLALSPTPELARVPGAMIGYARALTANSLLLQQDQLRAAGCDRLIEDRCGGNTIVRPALEQALAGMAAGDTLCVCRLDRLVWDTRDLMAFALSLSERGLHLVALAQDIDTRRDNGAFYGFAVMLPPTITAPSPPSGWRNDAASRSARVSRRPPPTRADARRLGEAAAGAGRPGRRRLGRGGGRAPRASGRPTR